MTRYENNAEAYTNGQVLTTSSPWQIVGSVIASTAAAVEGALGFSANGVSSTAAAGWNGTTAGAWGKHFPFSIRWSGDSPTPTGTSRIVNSYQNPGSSSSPCLVAESNGTFTLRNAALAIVATSPVRPAGVDLEFQLHFEAGTTTSNGVIEVRAYRLDTGALWWSESLTGQNAGVGSFYAVFAGVPTAGSWPAPVLFDAIALDTTATTFIPAVLSAPPVASLEKSLTHVFDFSGSTEVTSLSANQTSGDPVVIGINGLVASFDEPQDRETDIVIQFTLTGPGGTDVETVTVASLGSGTVTRRIGPLIKLNGVVK